MVARVIGKNVDWLAFETSDDCGYLEIIDYDHGDIDIEDTMEGNFTKCGQTIFRINGAKMTGQIEDLGISPQKAMDFIKEKNRLYDNCGFYQRNRTTCWTE